MKRIVLLVSVAAFTLALALAAADGTATPPPRLVVDDDRMQCAHADFTTIQAAVDAAPAGGLVRVCAGRYVEQVSVPKSLTIRADAEAVEAVECFSAVQPTADPSTQAIVAAPAGATSNAPAVLFDLQADNIELRGFVLLGRAGSTSRAVMTSSAHSGYRIHHNLIVSNTVAAYFRSNGVLPSSFHHNCVRDNGWGLVNQWLPLIDARVHHNSTFRTANITYEQTSYCPEFLATGSMLACAASRIGMDHVVFDHNVSIGDLIPYRLASSTSTTAFENTVTDARIGMRLIGANADLQIIGNDLEVRQVGLARGSGTASGTPEPSNLRVLIQRNTITGALGNDPQMPTAGIGMGVGGLKDSWILDNAISGFKGSGQPFPVCSGCGIALLADNTDNVIRGNTITNNASDGIQVAAGATRNVFEANQILDNGTINGVDARDDAWPSNVWRGNVCLTDIPAGKICGIG